MGRLKLTNEIFIERSNLVHEFKYNYDNVIYLSNKQKVIITCQIHGNFLQTPKAHLQGQGCPECSGLSRLQVGKFIQRSIVIHGDKYNYDKVVYQNIMSKVIITCKVHGDFKQVGHSHLNGKGCLKCSGKKKLTTDEFIRKSVEVHGNKYDYSLVNYIGANKLVDILCKKHGLFKQSPSNHVHNKQDCPRCVKYSIRSKGESIIESILNDNNINYKLQYTFTDLKNINDLYFDFAIFDEFDNLKFLIEFNGEQHYKYVKLFHKNKDGFTLSKERDLIKMKYCTKNGLKLIIIKYNDDIKKMMKLAINNLIYSNH